MLGKVPLGWRERLLSLDAGQNGAGSLGTCSPWFKGSLSRENKLTEQTGVFSSSSCPSWGDKSSVAKPLRPGVFDT